MDYEGNVTGLQQNQCSYVKKTRKSVGPIGKHLNPIVRVTRLPEMRPLRQDSAVEDPKTGNGSVSKHLNPIVRVKRLPEMRLQNHDSIVEEPISCKRCVSKHLDPVVRVTRLPEMRSHKEITGRSLLQPWFKLNENCYHPTNACPQSNMKLLRCQICSKLFVHKHHMLQHRFVHTLFELASGYPDNTILAKQCCVNLEYWRISLNSDQITFTNFGQNVALSPYVSFKNMNDEMKPGKLLTDDEVWSGLEGLASEHILVLPPSVCLKITLSPPEEVFGILANVDFKKSMIIAPISNARKDEETGYNTEGNHWSLIVIYIKSRKFCHLDSIPGHNHLNARQFCVNINFLLGFKPFKFQVRKCKRQEDNYSCGREVIRNAREQVSLLSKRMSLGKLPGNLYLTNNRKLVIVCDGHTQSMCSILKQLVPNCKIVCAHSGMSAMLFLNGMSTITKSNHTDCLVLTVRNFDNCHEIAAYISNIICMTKSLPVKYDVPVLLVILEKMSQKQNCIRL